MASEVETTAKPLDHDLAILDAYADQGVPSHWYVVPPVAQERILQAAAVLDGQAARRERRAADRPGDA